MTTIRLYWNNICVLHRQELQFLNEIREELRKDNIDLDITCFSLGYGRHMSNYLREEDSVFQISWSPRTWKYLRMSGSGTVLESMDFFH